jgi:hypothetical protein
MRILGDRLLLSPLPAKKLSDGGIHLLDGQVGDKFIWYRIDQVGTQVKEEVFHVGQVVVTPLYFTHTHLEDGTNRKIVGVDQIHGVILEPTPDI